MPKAKQSKQFIRVDKELFLIKQGDVTTATKTKQLYRIRIVQWGKHQAVLQKRLFVFSDQIMDYIPGRLMGFNLSDMQYIYTNKDKIMKIMKQSFDQLDDDSQYKRQIIQINQKNNENKD